MPLLAPFASVHRMDTPVICAARAAVGLDAYSTGQPYISAIGLVETSYIADTMQSKLAVQLPFATSTALHGCAWRPAVDNGRHVHC